MQLYARLRPHPVLAVGYGMVFFKPAEQIQGPLAGKRIRPVDVCATSPVSGALVPDKRDLPEGSIFLPPGGGRRYDMGGLQAVFKADEGETRERYSVSEWWLDPGTPGPGAHSHDGNDEVFYVIDGTPSLRIGDEWRDAVAGSFVMIPARTIHDFANRSSARAGLLNFFIPGGFERNMPDIVEWFRQNR